MTDSIAPSWSQTRRTFRLPLGSNELGLMAALVLVVLFTAILDRQHAYWHDPGGCVRDVLRQAVMLGIFTLGTAVVIVAGGIDLSSGSMIAFSGTVCAAIMMLLARDEVLARQGVPTHVVALAIAGTVLVAGLVGTLHAVLISWLGMPPFVATLGSLVGLRSLARVLARAVTESSQIPASVPNFRWLSSWDSRQVLVPVPVVTFVILMIAVGVLMSRTVLGRHLYAMGGNEDAARLSGIRISMLKWFVYVLSAVLASIAGMIYIGDQGVAYPERLAVGYELNAIAAAVVGGCSLKGGAGTVTGTVLGVLFLRVVIDAVQKIIDVEANLYEGMIVGIVVILAVAVSRLRRT
jgi:ribose/xylose/arabinose/galactoside ABC-type transport system permease subunit